MHYVLSESDAENLISFLSSSAVDLPPGIADLYDRLIFERTASASWARHTASYDSEPETETFVDGNECFQGYTPGLHSSNQILGHHDPSSSIFFNFGNTHDLTNHGASVGLDSSMKNIHDNETFETGNILVNDLDAQPLDSDNISSNPDNNTKSTLFDNDQDFQDDESETSLCVPHKSKSSAHCGRPQKSRSRKRKRGYEVSTSGGGVLNIGVDEDDNGGGGGGGGSGGDPAYLWGPECHRGGRKIFFDEPDRPNFAPQIEDPSNEEIEEELQELNAFESAEDHNFDSNNANASNDSEEPVSEKQPLSASAKAILEKVAVACQAITSNTRSSHFANASKILTILRAADQPHTSAWNINLDTDDNSLQTIALRCGRAENLKNCSQFVLLLNLMHFRAKVESIRRSSVKKICYSDILRSLEGLDNLGGVTRLTLLRWLKIGSMCCMLAAGGSLYLLAIVSCAHVKSKIDHLPTEQMLRLAALLRCPPPGRDGQKVSKYIIPAVAKLREEHDVSLSTMFSPEFLSVHNGPSKTYSSRNINDTDRFFDDHIPQNAFITKRNWIVWNSCRMPVKSITGPRNSDLSMISNFMQGPTRRSSLGIPVVLSPQSQSLATASTYFLSSPTQVPSSPILPLSSPRQAFLASKTKLYDDDVIFQINTMYDPTKNEAYAPGKRSSKQSIFSFTEVERDRASNAVVPTSLDDLSTKLVDLLKTGKKEKPDSYICIPRSISNEKIIRANDKNGEFLFILDPLMPNQFRENLLDDLEGLFPELRETNSRQEGINNIFPCAHFTVYNRYATHYKAKAKEYNVNINPVQYHREGKRKVNSCTFIPRSSKEIQNNDELFSVVTDVLEDVLTWQQIELDELIPDSVASLRSLVDNLPGNEYVAGYPFSGLVLNFNGASRVHRDWDDKDFCLVIPISDCRGGELALMEAGVVCDLKHGDMLIFRSSLLTHFNLHFTGKRASLVLHSDGFLDDWKIRNGWEKNTFFRST